MRKPKKNKFLEKINKMLDIEACQALLTEMEPLLHRVKISKESINILIKNNVSKEDPDKIKRLREYLLRLFQTEYATYKKAYNTLPPEAWENYELMGTEDMPEQIFLNKKAEELKEGWKNRPKRLRKNEKIQ